MQTGETLIRFKDMQLRTIAKLFFSVTDMDRIFNVTLRFLSKYYKCDMRTVLKVIKNLVHNQSSSYIFLTIENIIDH